MSANGTQSNFAKPKEANGADSRRIRWRRTVNINETIEIWWLVSRVPKTFTLAMASRRVAFSSSTSLLGTFSSLTFLALVTWTLTR